MIEWYKTVLQKYAVFNGRSRRSEYWYFTLANILIAIVLAITEALIGSFGLISWIYSLAVLIPGLAVSVRRLHDTNRSGWFLLLGLIPLVGAIILIVFLAQDGNKGENQYGADPKGTIV